MYIKYLIIFVIKRINFFLFFFFFTLFFTFYFLFLLLFFFKYKLFFNKKYNKNKYWIKFYYNKILTSFCLNDS